MYFSSFVFESLFQLAVIVPDALIALVIQKEAIRQAVRCPVLDDTAATDAMIRATLFRTGAFFDIGATHIAIPIVTVNVK